MRGGAPGAIGQRAQYVINPGGRGFNADGVKTENAWVFGLRTLVQF